MVAIHVKGEESEDQQFLYECSSSSSIDEIAGSISQISNLQSKIQTLALSIRTHVLTDQFKECCPEVALSVDRLVSEAESYASKDQVVYKRVLSPHILEDHIRSMEKGVEIARSKGLIDGGVLQVFSVPENNGHEGTQLWWAGKELVRGKKLSEYIGENEKTKIIVRLKSASSDKENHTCRPLLQCQTRLLQCQICYSKNSTLSAKSSFSSASLSFGVQFMHGLKR